MTHTLQIALLVAVVALWWLARPVLDPFRVRASSASQLSPYELSREWLQHGVQARERARRWRGERRAWLRSLAKHLSACEVRWRHEGWTGQPRVLTFHRRYAETEGQR